MGVICPKEGCEREFESERGMKQHHYGSHGEKIGWTEVTCYWCGSTIEKKDCEVNRTEKSFCDKGCKQEEFASRQSGKNNPRWDENKSKNEHTCQYCGDKYMNYKSSDETKCCSRECYANWMSENWVGEDCPAWRGGRYFYYGPSWQRARREAIDNADEACEYCGMSNEKHKEKHKQGLHVHHIEKFKNFGLENHKRANEQSNLMVLCRECHTEIEP